MTQTEALNILKLGHTTFLTGGAGTGKTYVLNEFIKYLTEYGINHAVTASTGIAATHISGQTLHSWSGLGIKDKINGWDLEMMSQNEKLNKRINETKVLIIDEISMLHASRLDMLDQVLRFIRKSETPFGGMQVVFCGDFFQLPPVVKDKSISDLNKQNEYAFNSQAWKKSKPVICYLTENYRQEDNTLTNILNMIRAADEDIYESLESLNETKENVLVNPVKLFSHNKEVDKINLENYINLQSDHEYEFTMITKGKKPLVESLKQNILTDENLKLKVGTKVIFIKNDKNNKYQNGSLGIIKEFNSDNYPVVELINGDLITAKEDVWQIKDEDDNVLAEVSQLPLRYAWAITIHKSQGMTLDEAEIDLSEGFGYGMGYVALSRVRSLEGLKLHGLNNQSLMVANHVLEYDKILKDKSEKAIEALNKYGDEDLNQLHQKVREKMNALSQKLTKEEIKERKEKEIKEKVPTQTQTLNLILEGKNLQEIATERQLTVSTILDHIHDIKELSSFDHESEISVVISKMVSEYLKDYIKQKNIYKKILNKKTIANIKEDMLKEGKLKPVYEKYSSEFANLDYDTLKLIKVL